MSTLRLEGLSKVFNQGLANEYAAIRHVDLTIEEQQVTVFKGASGSGKTTLLSMIGCLSRPSSGRIFRGEQQLSGLPERFTTQLRRQTFGFIFQQFNLIKGLTVMENVMLPAYPVAPEYSRLITEAQHLLGRFALAHRASAKIETLSGGEAQRTAICRALINQPEILIADEPTANLDSKLSLEFLDIVNELRSVGKTIILSSHDPLLIESEVINRVVTVHDGRILE